MNDSVKREGGSESQAPKLASKNIPKFLGKRKLYKIAIMKLVATV